MEEFLRPSFLKQDEGQRGKSRNKKFEYICNALVRAGGTLTKDEFIKVNVSFYLEEMGIQPIDDGFWCYSEFQFKYLEREFMDRLKGSEKERSSLAILRRILQRREDILDAGIVVKKDDGSYTFHDGIISLIGYLL